MNKLSFFTNTTISQLIRYGVIGVMNNCLLYLGYLFIVYLGGGNKLSMTLMYLTGVAIGYIANHKWTFSQEKNRGALLRYLQMHITGYLINFLLLYVFVDFLHYPHQLVQVSAIITVAFFGFFACKYFVFRSDST